jgi:GNAT superfamily N-acetyltransferase
MVSFKVSFAAASDLDLLVRHRVGMWIAIRPELAAQAREMSVLTRDWIKKMLSEGRLIGFIVKTESDQVAGSGCIWLREQPPRFSDSRLEAPYLMSMYTEEAFRRKGVASLIVQKAIEWSKTHGYSTITLNASEEGIPLYERFGFKMTTEMRLKLN